MPRLALALLVIVTSSALALAAEKEPAAGDVAGALVILDVRPAARPGFVPEALPPRFVLFEDGALIVGGYSGLASMRLERDALKALDKRLSQVKRLPGLGARVSFGAGPEIYRLRLPQERVDLTAGGDPEQAPPELRPLATLLHDLASFDHAALRPLQPTHLLASARAEALPGGCRAWRALPRVSDLVAQPQPIPAQAAAGWPTGAYAASVCEDGRRFTLSLRPLLPGERP